MNDYTWMDAAIRGSQDGTHPGRAMAVTLECGHLRLMEATGCVMGVGSFTSCRVCPDSPARMVCKIEETGQLHPDYRPPVVRA